jgi:2-haloacid dehalogenase
MRTPDQPSRAVIFDIGGVLLNWNPHHVYLKRFGGDAQAVDAFLNEIGFYEWNTAMDQNLTFAEGVAELSARFPQYSELIRAWDDHWEEAISGQIQASVDILYALKQAGVPVYALSNWSEEKYKLTRPRFPFFNWFDGLVISGQIGILKPDPRIYAYLIEKIQLPAKNCVFIDDTAVNVEGARQAGLDAIHFQSPGQLKKDLLQRGLLS